MRSGYEVVDATGDDLARRVDFHERTRRSWEGWKGCRLRVSQTRGDLRLGFLAPAGAGAPPRSCPSSFVRNGPVWRAWTLVSHKSHRFARAHFPFSSLSLSFSMCVKRAMYLYYVFGSRFSEESVLVEVMKGSMKHSMCPTLDVSSPVNRTNLKSEPTKKIRSTFSALGSRRCTCPPSPSSGFHLPPPQSRPAHRSSYE